jgi:hypothetical protein
MIYNHDEEPKKWNNKCPKCGSSIRWNHWSSEDGSKSNAHCSNGLTASRVSVASLQELNICFWKGYVIRQKDGGVRFKDANGEWLRE